MNSMKLRAAVAAISALIVMVWLAARAENWEEAFPLKGQKNDYYNLLVDGFAEGHLHMKVPVDPGLLNQDTGRQTRVPYLHDASEYHGRYYLYFGVVPAVLAFWPYAALTGHDLPGNLAVLIAVAAGFLVWLRLYTDARSRYFPAVPAWFELTAVGLLAFATGLPVLLVSGGMYEVALAWGGLWVAGMTWCLFRALHSERKAGAWLVAASLAYGLGVGSRPTIFLLGPLLLVVAWLVFRARPAGSRGLMRLAGAVVIPAGVIGLGLMLYNYARFDSPFEFGLNHQLNAIAGNGRPLQSAAFIPANLRWFYFTPPTFSAYFPYLFPHSNYPAPAGYYVGSEPTHGQFTLLPLAVICVLAAVWRKPAFPRLLRWFLGLLVFSFLVILLMTSTFCYGRSTRYLVDFQPPLIMLLLLVAGVPSQTGTRSGRWPRLWPGAFVVIGTAACLSSLLIALQFLDRFALTHPREFQTLAYYGNYPASWLARLGWHQYGSLRFKAVFTKQTTPVYEAMVATGAPTYKDVLFAAQYPNGYVDFIVYHEGYGGARSKLIPIEYGRPYEMELDLGSLYPPLDCAYFPRWGDLPREILKGFTRVAFDGTTVIRTQQPFYDSSPGLLDFGRAPGRPERSFSGRLYDIKRQPMLDTAGLKALAEAGVWQFDLTLPPPENLSGQPVLSSGVTGRGNMLYLHNLPDGTFQFGVDFWGIGARFSPPLARTSADSRLLEIFVGPQVARGGPRLFPGLDVRALQAGPPLLRVWLDGQLVWTTELIAHADTYDFVGVGTNTQRFSTTEPVFAGRLQPWLLLPADVRALMEKNLALASP